MRPSSLLLYLHPFSEATMKIQVKRVAGIAQNCQMIGPVRLEDYILETDDIVSVRAAISIGPDAYSTVTFRDGHWEILKGTVIYFSGFMPASGQDLEKLEEPVIRG